MARIKYILLDKTGTMTTNEMQLKQIRTKKIKMNSD